MEYSLCQLDGGNPFKPCEKGGVQMGAFNMHWIETSPAQLEKYNIEA